MIHRTVAIATTDPDGRTFVKRVRVDVLHVYERAGWHCVPRGRFKRAKRAHERPGAA